MKIGDTVVRKNIRYRYITGIVLKVSDDKSRVRIEWQHSTGTRIFNKLTNWVSIKSLNLVNK